MTSALSIIVHYHKIQWKTILNPCRCTCHPVWLCAGESIGRCCDRLQNEHCLWCQCRPSQPRCFGKCYKNTVVNTNLLFQRINWFNLLITRGTRYHPLFHKVAHAIKSMDLPRTRQFQKKSGTVEKHSLNLFDFGIKRQDCLTVS